MRSLFGTILLLLSFQAFSQISSVSVSGVLKDKKSGNPLPFVNIIIKAEKDSAFISGTVSTEDGRFTLSNVAPGNYILEISYVGYTRIHRPLLVGKLSQYLDLGILEMEEAAMALNEVVITGTQDAVAETLDKKTFKVSDNINQSG